MYAVTYERRAKAEYEDAKETYGGAFGDELSEWINRVVSEAERRDYSLSIDAIDVMDEAIRSKRSSWRLSWKRLLDAKLIAKFKAILVIVKKRCPPWELRAAYSRFKVISTFDCEVTVFFEVNHVDKRIIFRLFDGLPGQG